MASYLTGTVLTVKNANPGDGWTIGSTPIGAQAVFASETGRLVVSLVSQAYTNIELHPGTSFNTAGVRITAQGVIPATTVQFNAAITIDGRRYNVPIETKITQAANSDPQLEISGDIPFEFSQDLLKLSIDGIAVSTAFGYTGVVKKVSLSRTLTNSFSIAITVKETPSEKIDTTNILDIFNKPECGVGPVSPIEPDPEVVPCPEIIEPPIIDPENPPIPIPPIIPIIPPPVPTPDDNPNNNDNKCKTQIRWTYSTVYKCSDPPIRMMVQQISECNYWVHMTFYVCPPYHNNKPCCQYIWCDSTWEHEEPPTTEPPAPCTYSCRWVWLPDDPDYPLIGEWKLEQSCQNANVSLCTCAVPDRDGLYHGELMYVECRQPDAQPTEFGQHLDMNNTVSDGRWALRIEYSSFSQSNYDYCAGKTPPGITGRFPGELITVCECDPAPVGACCHPDGHCEDGLTQGECEDGGGTYQGDDSVCEDVVCPTTPPPTTTSTTSTTTAVPIGACCLPNGLCVDGYSPTSCASAGGTFQGDGTTCATVVCPTTTTTTTLVPPTTTTTTTTGSPTSPPNFGICCHPNGTCITYVDQSYCDGIGGIFLPGATDCIVADCQPVESGCSTADCMFTWSAIDEMWIPATNGCTVGCMCQQPTSPGSFDGQTVFIPCVGA